MNKALLEVLGKFGITENDSKDVVLKKMEESIKGKIDDEKYQRLVKLVNDSFSQEVKQEHIVKEVKEKSIEDKNKKSTIIQASKEMSNSKRLKVIFGIVLIGILFCVPLYDFYRNHVDKVPHENYYLAKVEIDDKYGFIDVEGNLVIDTIYDDALDFSEGFAAVKQNGGWGYINNKGKLVIEMNYDKVTSFGDGHAWVLKSWFDNKVKAELINTSGEVVNTIEDFAYNEILPPIGNVSIVSNDIIRTRYGDGDLLYHYGSFDDIGAINIKTGEAVIPKVQWNIVIAKEKNYIEAYDINSNPFSHYSYYDLNGVPYFPIPNKDISDAVFSNENGYGFLRGVDGACAIIKYNEILSDFIYEDCWGFVDGIGTVTINNQVHVIDESGNILLTSTPNKGINLSHDGHGEGLISFQNSEGKWGFIDKTGKIKIEPTFYKGGKFFENGLAGVWIDEDTIALIDKQGNILYKSKEVRSIDYLSNGFMQVQSKSDSSLSGLMSPEGELVFPMEYSIYSGRRSEVFETDWVVLQKDFGGSHIFYNTDTRALVEDERVYWYDAKVDLFMGEDANLKKGLFKLVETSLVLTDGGYSYDNIFLFSK